MGTTKLTRKEILGQDPVYDAIVKTIEFFGVHGKPVGLGILSILLLGSGGYFGLRYLESRDMEIQQRLSRGIDFYHAQIDASALDDPFGKGPQPLFRNAESKFKAALQEFTAVTQRTPSSKPGVIARYYLGLCQKNLGQPAEAIKTLEQVRNNSVDLTVGYLAKKVLAMHYTESGNYKGAQEILDGMIKDPQCPLPKEDLRMQLAKVYVVQGKREEGLKLLRQARDEAGASPLQMMLTQELSRLETASSGSNATETIPIR